MKEECESCGYITELKNYRSSSVGPDIKTAMLCNICSSTLIGNAHSWPKQYDNIEILRTLGWIANKIIDTIKEMK